MTSIYCSTTRADCSTYFSTLTNILVLYTMLILNTITTLKRVAVKNDPYLAVVKRMVPSDKYIYTVEGTLILPMLVRILSSALYGDVRWAHYFVRRSSIFRHRLQSLC